MLQTGELIIQRGNLNNGNLTVQTGSLTSGSLSGPATYVSVENDPLFRASVAYTITQEDIDRWNEEIDLSAYVTHDGLGQTLMSYVSYSYLYSYVSYAINDIDLSEYATMSYVAEYVNTYVPEPDLSDYPTFDDIAQMGYITSIPSEFVTEQELSACGYITMSDVSACGYLTQHQSLEGLVNEDDLHTILSTYATKNYVDNAILNAEIGGGGEVTIDLSYYLRKDELDSVLTSYVTKTELSAQSYISSNTVENLLVSYVKKGELTDALGSYVSQNDLGQVLNSYVSKTELTEALGSYVSYSYLESKHYLTEHQDLSDYATKAYVMDKIADVEAGVVDLSSYVSKTELSEQSYITRADVGNLLASYVSYSYLYSYIGDVVNDIEAGTVDLSTYVSKTELSAQSYITMADVSNCGYVTENTVGNMLDSYATKAYVMDKINGIQPVSYNINNTYTIPVWQGTYAQYTALPDHTTYKLYLIAQE